MIEDTLHSSFTQKNLAKESNQLQRENISLNSQVNKSKRTFSTIISIYRLSKLHTTTNNNGFKISRTFNGDFKGKQLQLIKEEKKQVQSSIQNAQNYIRETNIPHFHIEENRPFTAEEQQEAAEQSDRNHEMFLAEFTKGELQTIMLSFLSTQIKQMEKYNERLRKVAQDQGGELTTKDAATSITVASTTTNNDQTRPNSDQTRHQQGTLHGIKKNNSYKN